MERKYFIVPTIFSEAIYDLSDKSAGKVFKALFEYVETGNFDLPKETNAKGVFLCIKGYLDEQNQVSKIE